jgi:hypothetical protein
MRLRYFFNMLKMSLNWIDGVVVTAVVAVAIIAAAVVAAAVVITLKAI